MRSIALAAILTLAALPALAQGDPPGTFTYQQCATMHRLQSESQQLEARMDQAMAYISGSARSLPAAIFQQTGVKPADLGMLQSARPRIGKLPTFALPIKACGGRKDPILTNEGCQQAITSAQQAAGRFNQLLPIVERFVAVSNQWGMSDPARSAPWRSGFAFLRQSMQQAMQKVSEGGQIVNAACSQKASFNSQQQQMQQRGGQGNQGGKGDSRSRSPFRSPVNRD